MNVDEILSKTIGLLMDKRLSKAIDRLDQLYAQRPSLMGHGEFEAIKTDYQLMQELEKGVNQYRKYNRHQSIDKMSIKH